VAPGAEMSGNCVGVYEAVTSVAAAARTNWHGVVFC
jgi:hypothetical protein